MSLRSLVVMATAMRNHDGVDVSAAVQPLVVLSAHQQYGAAQPTKNQQQQQHGNAASVAVAVVHHRDHDPQWLQHLFALISHLVQHIISRSNTTAAVVAVASSSSPPSSSALSSTPTAPYTAAHAVVAMCMKTATVLLEHASAAFAYRCNQQQQLTQQQLHWSTYLLLFTNSFWATFLRCSHRTCMWPRPPFIIFVFSFIITPSSLFISLPPATTTQAAPRPPLQRPTAQLHHYQHPQHL